MDTKQCFKCGTSKPLTEFYRHKAMAGGYLGKCKECAKIDVKKHRQENADYFREYDKMRFQRDPWRKEANKKRALTAEGKQSTKLSRLKWLTNNPDKRAAHVLLGNAVRGGRIEKPKDCSRCGKTPQKRYLHAHHHDYTKPLDVEWICVWCHAAEHFPNEYREIMNG